MTPLSAQALLHIWEMGKEQHPVDQALIILSAALPTMAPVDLLNLSIGQRNGLLLDVRMQTFGRQLACMATCPACQAKLEFTIDVHDLVGEHDTAKSQREQQMTMGCFTLSFRLPNSLDLAAIAAQTNVKMARSVLLQRCIMHVGCEGVSAPVEQLSEEVLVALDERMEQCDPHANLLLLLTCPECGYDSQPMFDIVSFFWTELCAQAKQLLREVHILAQAYGWRESDILTMSATRRQCYLEMVM